MKAAELKFSAEFSHRLSSTLEAINSPADDVQIWSARLDSIFPGEMVELTALLDPAEGARAAQFRFERDRHHFIAARGLLRHLLGVALDIPAFAIAFDYGPHGKPAIAAATDAERTLHFNISHANGAAMFALGWNRHLGIDLESSKRLLSRSQDLSDLARRILSPREFAIWSALPNDSMRGPAFLRAWTRKEAYVKAIGAGLFDRLQTVEIALDAANPQPSLTIDSSGEGQVGSDWIIHDLPAPAGFIAAIAVELLHRNALD